MFNDFQKNSLLNSFKNKITKDGFIVIVNQESRSAVKNKKAALSNLLNLLQKALIPKKKRKKVKLPKALNEKRLANKKRNSEKKGMRKKVNSGIF